MSNTAISAPDFREERAQKLHEKDMNNDNGLVKAIATCDHEMVTHAISL